MAEEAGWVDELDGVRRGQVWRATAPGRPGRHVLVDGIYDPDLDPESTVAQPIAHVVSVVQSPTIVGQWMLAGRRPPLRLVRLQREYVLVSDPTLDKRG